MAGRVVSGDVLEIAPVVSLGIVAIQVDVIGDHANSPSGVVLIRCPVLKGIAHDGDDDSLHIMVGGKTGIIPSVWLESDVPEVFSFIDALRERLDVPSPFVERKERYPGINIPHIDDARWRIDAAIGVDILAGNGTLAES